MAPLDALLDLLEAAGGPAEPPPPTDGWELVLAANVAYPVDDQHRRDAMERLRRLVGIEPSPVQVLASRSTAGAWNPAYHPLRADSAARASPVW